MDGSRPALPWLTAVLSKKAADQKRRARRPLELERLLQSVDGDASQPAEQRELSGELAKAIDALEEPYRQVMILRLRHGLSPADIAHVLERSPGAVRVQLHRAQHKLRGRLPSSLVFGLIGSALGPRGLAALRAELVAKAASMAPAAVSAAPTATVVGSMVTSKKLGLTLAAGLIATGAWQLTAREASPRPMQSASAASAQELAPVVDPRNARRSVLEEARPSPPAEPQRPEPEAVGALAIQVLWADGSAAAGVGLEQLKYADAPRVTRWLTDGAGRVHIPRIGAGKRGFLVDRWSKDDPQFQQMTFTAEVRAGVLNHLRIDLPAGHDVRGRVVDAHGVGVQGAELWGSWSSWMSPSLVGHATEDGSFHLRALPAQGYFLYAKAEQRGISRSVPLAELEGDAGGTLLAELRLSETTAELGGRVIGARGEPIADADVIVTLESHTVVSRKLLRARTQADGGFRLSGLCRSSLTVQVGASDYPIWATQLELEDGQTKWLDVRLQDGVTVVGTVRADGEPALRVAVEWAENRALAFPGDLAWKRVLGFPDASGAYRLTGLPAGPIRLKAERRSRRGGESEASTELYGAPGATLRWDVVLDPGTGPIVGRVDDPLGLAPGAWLVDAVAYGSERATLGAAWTDSAGRFVLAGCQDVPHVVRLLWPVGAHSIAERDFVRPGAGEVRFEVTRDMLPTASVSGTVLTADGAASDSSVSAVDELGGVRGSTECGLDGRFQIDRLSAGRYKLISSSKLLAEEVLATFELGPDQAVEAGTLSLSDRGFLEVRMERVDGATLSAPASFLIGDDGRREVLTSLSTEDGALYRSRALTPGRYSLYPAFAHAGAAMQTVLIRAGEVVSLEIPLVPAASLTVGFRVPAGAPPPSVLEVTVFDAGRGKYLQASSHYLARDRDGYWSHFLLGSYPVGLYRFEATSAEGFTAQGNFEITDPELPCEGLTVELVQPQ